MTIDINFDFLSARFAAGRCLFFSRRKLHNEMAAVFRICFIFYWEELCSLWSSLIQCVWREENGCALFPDPSQGKIIKRGNKENNKMRLMNSGPANGHERNWKQRDEFSTMTHHQHEANTQTVYHCKWNFNWGRAISILSSSYIKYLNSQPVRTSSTIENKEKRKKKKI